MSRQTARSSAPRRPPPSGRGKPRPGRARRGRGVGLLLTAGMAVIALAVGTWVVTRGDGADNRAATGGPSGAGPGVVHIHGLGINPKDNALFVATHTGLFRITAESKAERMGDRFQDTMGFTIVGPDRFLGSGHPDLREMREQKLPPLLGLIESTDVGRSWRPLSLHGKADFHALHNRIYGYDSTSTSFMVSPDGKTWDTRSRLPMSAFAVSPADPELVIAAAQTGPLRSRDGDRTWERLNAPPLAVLAWDTPDGLRGIAPTGAVYRSADGGTSWEQRGALAGQPAAFLAAGGALYATIHDGSIYRSTDGGSNWQLRFRDAAASQSSRP